MALLQLSHLSGAVVATFSGLLLPRLLALSRRSTERAGGRRAGARVDELGLLGDRVLHEFVLVAQLHAKLPPRLLCAHGSPRVRYSRREEAVRR